MNFEQIKSVLNDKKYRFVFLISLVSFSTIVIYFTNLELNLNNFGKLAYFQFTTDIIIAFSFAIFLALFLHNYSLTKKLQHKRGFVGGILGTLFFGCAACSITLAGYLGIAGFISFFPFYGLELKLLALGILILSISKLSKTKC
jgi:hypothetical protein